MVQIDKIEDLTFKYQPKYMYNVYVQLIHLS